MVILYNVDSEEVCFTHHINSYFLSFFSVPKFVGSMKLDIQSEDQMMFPDIPFNVSDHSLLNGLDSIWCSKRDFRFEYISRSKFLPTQIWADEYAPAYQRIAAVLEAYFRKQGVVFVRANPSALTQV